MNTHILCLCYKCSWRAHLWLRTQQIQLKLRIKKKPGFERYCLLSLQRFLAAATTGLFPFLLPIHPNLHYICLVFHLKYIDSYQDLPHCYSLLSHSWYDVDAAAECLSFLNYHTQDTAVIHDLLIHYTFKGAIVRLSLHHQTQINVLSPQTLIFYSWKWNSGLMVG